MWKLETVQPDLILDFFLRNGKTRRSIPESRDETKELIPQ